MLGVAGICNCAAAVPLLLAAGAQVTLREINHTIEAGSPEALEALLAAAQPRAPGGGGGLNWPLSETACPLWMAVSSAHKTGLRSSAAMIELLLTAGYQPVTYASAQETDGDAVYTVSWACWLAGCRRLLLHVTGS